MQTRVGHVTFNDGKNVHFKNLVILVGPNNAGKSRVLADIVEHFNTTSTNDHHVLSDVSITLPGSIEEVAAETGLTFTPSSSSGVSIRGLNNTLMTTVNNQGGNHQHLLTALASGDRNAQRSALGRIGQGILVWLGTEQRLGLSRQAASSNDPEAPASLLDVLYWAMQAAEDKLNQAFRRAFSQMLKLDYSMRPELHLRIGGDDLANVSVDPRIQGHELRNKKKLQDEGDGLRSFAGICLALELSPRKLVLIDEPETFLHPPQALELGRYLKEKSADRQIIVATHSSDIVRAMLDGDNSNTTVVRITRQDALNHPHIVNSDTLQVFSSDPLLRSTRSLEGMFYSGVVVSEGDSDRSVYELASQKVSPGNDVYYTHAHNKQTIGKVVAAYRSLSVPCASVVDFDVLNEADVLNNLLEAHGCPEEIKEEILKGRQSIATHVGDTSKPEDRCNEVLGLLKNAVQDLEATDTEASDKLKKVSRIADTIKHAKDPWRDAKTRGQNAFANTPVEAECNNILSLAKNVGVFIVPGGELESWLTKSVKGPKGEWTINALKLIPQLLFSTNDDIWQFISEIHTYLEAAN